MRDLIAVLALAVPLVLLAVFFIFAIVSAWRQKRQDRRSIMATGTSATAVVTNAGGDL
jgi:preprotein translocase subunit YajC